jgi:hypothetical protein
VTATAKGLSNDWFSGRPQIGKVRAGGSKRMTQPRFIIPGETIFVTVRTLARFYLLRPDPELVESIKYCLAHYANKHGLVLSAVCVMSTHIHLVAFDERGLRSVFLRDVNRGIANVVKALRGWRGPVFRPKPNIVRLLTPEAIVDKIAYTVANPVAAGAVRRFEDWPGLCHAAGLSLGGQKKANRPRYFFSDKGELPKSAKLSLELPPALVDTHGRSKTRGLIATAVARHEAQAREEVQRLGWKVLGPVHCLKLSPFQRAKAYEVFGATEPTFAVLGGGRDLYVWAARQLRVFRRRYREALERWRSGKRKVLFPFGTWLMRVNHGVRCDAATTVSPLPSGT